MKKLDLGQTRKELYSSDGPYDTCCGISDSELSDEEKAKKKEEFESKKMYPSFYISNRKGNPKIPMKGKAVIEYEIRSKEIKETDKGERYSMDIEVVSFEPQGSGPDTTNSKDMDAIEEGLSEAETEEDEE